MKMKDILNIKDKNPKSLLECKDKKEKEPATVSPTAYDDVPNVPGKPVVKKEKRYTDEEGLSGDYDHVQNFERRDSGAEYVRSMVKADEIFNEIGIQDKKQSEEFFNIFPKINAKDAEKVDEMYRYGRRENKTFIIEQDQNQFLLVNHDNTGKVYENEIVFNPMKNQYIIECNNPESVSVIQHIPKGDRYKHSLRSKELQYVLEFQQMTGTNCYIKNNFNDMAFKI